MPACLQGAAGVGPGHPHPRVAAGQLQSARACEAAFLSHQGCGSARAGARGLLSCPGRRRAEGPVNGATPASVFPTPFQVWGGHRDMDAPPPPTPAFQGGVPRGSRCELRKAVRQRLF